jgi:hypothetical protein
MYLTSDRPGGFGSKDIWVSTRSSLSDPWPEPVNLGPGINTSFEEAQAALSFDGTELYFQSNRAGGASPSDLWVCIRVRFRHD